jgi:hypothetical protein
MKVSGWIAGMAMLTGLTGGAVEEAPSLTKTPTAFETRNTGETEEGEASIEKEEGKTTTSHLKHVRVPQSLCIRKEADQATVVVFGRGADGSVNVTALR